MLGLRNRCERDPNFETLEQVQGQKHRQTALRFLEDLWRQDLCLVGYGIHAYDIVCSHSATKPKPLDILETKAFAWQMFRGLNWMHKNEVFHRDLKPQNILINPETCLLQIADFGSSVILGEFDSYSSYHVTRYYRPPELLLGAHNYGPAIDVWSAGCVFAEMLRGRTFLPGSTTENQLEKILECFGAPTKTQMKDMHPRRPKLIEKPAMVKAIETFNERGQNGLKSLVPSAPSEALKLLEDIFNYSPSERLHGPKLLADPFFEEIFEPELQHNGKPWKLLTKKDYNKAVAGDTPLGFKIGSSESHTKGSVEKSLEKIAEPTTEKTAVVEKPKEK